MTDKQALAEFVKSRSGEAFAVLTRRYVDLVYSTARRMARDAHLAEDITQAVFIVLARRAGSVNPKYLAGWLVNTSRLAARQAIRSRNREQNREAQAAYMRSEIQTGDEPTAEQISPLLDDALAKLSAADRSAVVMRFLQGRSFAEVGHELEISEEAARKRVERSIQKLRSILCKQGIAASVGGLTVTLAAHQATAAPVVLASQAAVAISSQSTGAALIAKGVVWTMSMAKAQLVAFLILIALGLVGGGMIAIVKAQHNPSTASSVPATTLPASQPALTEERIQLDDRLIIVINDLVGLNKTTSVRRRVDPSGRIQMPNDGGPPIMVRVSGQTTSEATVTVAKAFADAMVIAHARVTVAFDERGSGISIHSGPFQIGDHVRFHIWDLLGLGVETTTLCVVDSEGNISLPRISANGTPNPAGVDKVKVLGLTEFEAERMIIQQYQSAQLIMHAMVIVERISEKEAATDSH